MDTAALQLLGVTPELGAEVTVSYSISDKDQAAFTVTDTFTLVGYWDMDASEPSNRAYGSLIQIYSLYSNFNYGVVKFNQLSASDTQRQCVFGYIVESSVLSRFFYEVLP